MAWNNLGVGYALQGRPSDALAAYRKARLQWQSLGDQKANQLHNIGAQLLALGRFRDGIDYLRQAVDIRRRREDRGAQGRSLLVGLAQGFFAAGASHLVVSYWDVDDVATAELMVRFYGHLFKDGLGPVDALRRAKLELRRETDSVDITPSLGGSRLYAWWPPPQVGPLYPRLDVDVKRATRRSAAADADRYGKRGATHPRRKWPMEIWPGLVAGDFSKYCRNRRLSPGKAPRTRAML